jgi:hypothetical protein
MHGQAEREWKELKWNQEQERRDALTEERRKRQEEEFDAEVNDNLIPWLGILAIKDYSGNTSILSFFAFPLKEISSSGMN